MDWQDRKHAVVIGAGMAGLMAARVLSDHFEMVTIVDRDELPPDPLPRPGVPQSPHVHVLLPKGHDLVEHWFPGITEDWTRAGAVLLDAGRDLAWLGRTGFGYRYESGLRAVAASRPLLEWAVRKRVATVLDNVMFLQHTRVRGLLSDSTGKRVTGVRLQFQQDAAGEEIAEYAADLVVDCSGRHSSAPQWLEEIGYEPPAESMVNARLGYASRIYRRDPNHDLGWRALFIQAAPPECARGGVLFPIEGDRWLLTMVGGGGDFAPTDEEGYREFARSLPYDGFQRIIESCPPLSPIVGYRRTENRWRHYERLRLPEGLLVMGDSVCSFNPVYGQGITVSALESLELGTWLQKQCSGQVFQRRLAKIVRGAWDFSTGEDLRYSGVEGATAGAAQRFLHWYVDRTADASIRDRDVRHGFLEVFGMRKPPTHLFSPAMVLRILFRGSSGNRVAPCPQRPVIEPTVSESSMSVSETYN